MKLSNNPVILTAWLGLALGQGQDRSRPQDCGRSCLEGVMSEYLNAVVDHDPSRLPTTPNVKYVENDQILPMRKGGEWPIAGSLGKYRHVFADIEAGQVGAITTMTENGVGVIYVVRLKVEDNRKISEIETQITRDAGGAALYEKLDQPEAVWLETVPIEEQIPRDRLISQTNMYYSSMENNSPKGNYSFFDKDCNRLEDGLQTTNVKTGDPYGHSNDTSFASLGCEAQFQTGFLGFVTKIRDRHFPIVDEERQAVLAITTFDHNGTVRTLPGANGTSSPIPAYFDVPRTLLAAEAFRLRGEKLFRIEMTLTEVPYGMRYAFQNSRSDRNNFMVPIRSRLSAKKKPVDRTHLEGVLNQVLQALLAHDASGLPLSKNVLYSENGQFIALGDGLWETLSHIAIAGGEGMDNQYAASFADPASGTAAYWGLTREQSTPGTPGVLALRVQLDSESGEITEIEAIDIRTEFSGDRGGTLTLMRPPLPVEFEQGEALGQLDPVFQLSQNHKLGGIPRKLIDSYFDGLQRHSSKRVSFAPDCTRRDNAVVQQRNLSCAAQMDGNGLAPNGLYNTTATVRDRRILVADAEKGVVMVVAMIDNDPVMAAPGSLLPSQLVPSTYMIPQLIKMDNGSIFRIEGMVRWVPFGYTSAWVGR